MGNITGFTVALPFLIIIGMYVVLKYEQDHLRKTNAREIIYLLDLMSELLRKIDPELIVSIKSDLTEKINSSNDNEILTEKTKEMLLNCFEK